MSSAVADLETQLQAMLALRPPGVSGSKIANITALCTANVQSESVLIQKLYTHFKKAPGTHKLGVLYVVDSVTRKWTEQAKTAGQPITSSAQDGTFAAGVHRVKELLPVLMNDIITTAPEDQKDKIRKLVDIWEKGQTFPLAMLNSFKDKLNTPAQNMSTTPEGTPPPGLAASLAPQQPTQPQQPAQKTESILEALANMARQNTIAPASSSAAPAPLPSFPPPNLGQPMAPINSAYPYVQAPVLPVQLHPQSTPFQSNPAQSFAAPPSAPPPQAGVVDPALQQKIAILKVLAEQGVPQDQWGQIIDALTAAGAQGAPSNPAMPSQAAPPLSLNTWGARPEEARDRNGFPDSVRSPGRLHRRSRSPSPVRGWGSRNSPQSRRRDEPGFGDYDRSSPGRGRDRGRGGGRINDFRQRSPVGRRGRSLTPPTKDNKYVDYDPSIGPGNIKVLSRTLFVGGVTCPELELREIFNRFGTVQTCIVNRDKRHAFVKMISRRDAVSAKDAMEANRGPDSSLRTRWGVGFGPRECSDYHTGVSIIPINKLTDADRKWMLTAEYGGSGGKPIEGGMVVEEPDIEIGQGVSSKAISRRMQTDKGGHSGPRSGRGGDDDDGGRYRRDRPDSRGRDDFVDRSGAGNGPMGGFPYGMPNMAGGMPMFPQGFMFPGQQPPGGAGHRG